MAEAFPGVAAVADAVACERGYELALGAALAQYPGTLTVGRGEDHWSLLEALRAAGVRLVRLLVPVTDPRREPPQSFPGAVALLDKVTIDVESDLERALADAVIVDDLSAVPASFTGLAVTREGAYYRPSSGLLGLAAGVPAALLVERRARLETLVERRDALRAREARETVAVARARASAEALAVARATATRGLGEALSALEAARRADAATAAATRALQDRLERSHEANARARAELASLTGESDPLDETLAATGIALAAARVAVGEAEGLAAAAEAAHAATLAELTRARIELDERRAHAERVADEQARARRRIESARARLRDVAARLAALPAGSAACAETITVLDALQARIEPLVERLVAEAGEAEGRVRERGEARRLADEEATLRREADELGERRATAQVGAARLEERRDELAARFDEVAAALETAVFTPPADEAEAAALRVRVERLERRREGVGPVNPLAEAECARLQEHVDFLREQRKDLERSLEETERLIVELTQRIEGDFEATFAVVRENFVHMVGILFPGGHGRLMPVPGDDGQPAGVAIEVKPARKLGRKLTLLSGGERSLVALAFLLALLLSKTCAFYILDEVEAALDDINIGLFVSLVREYKTRTQFLIITHQKRTMEAADLLYGVTMGPDGTSHVVSARMAEEEIDRETTAGRIAARGDAPGPGAGES